MDFACAGTTTYCLAQGILEMEDTNPKSAEGATQDLGPETDELGKIVNEYETKIGEMRDLLLRERAEIENQRKRLARDVEQARKFANERLLGELLPVCDNLERGLAVENADTAALREGMDLTL